MLTGGCSPLRGAPPYYWHAEFFGAGFPQFSYDNGVQNMLTAGLTVSGTAPAPLIGPANGGYSSTLSSGVPEPTTLILTIIGGVILFAGRRRRFTRA
jgi:hypothetical protein